MLKDMHSPGAFWYFYLNQASGVAGIPANPNLTVTCKAAIIYGYRLIPFKGILFQNL